MRVRVFPIRNLHFEVCVFVYSTIQTQENKLNLSFRLATVLNVDKIYFIEKGEVLEEGTHDELLAQKGKYYNLVLENDPNLAAPAVDADASRREYLLWHIGTINDIYIYGYAMPIERI